MAAYDQTAATAPRACVKDSLGFGTISSCSWSLSPVEARSSAGK
jgi:hypothetical protein